MAIWERIAGLIAAHGAAVLVSVLATRGSVPREAGARMVVLPDGRFHGTIGGGSLEWQALARAQGMMAQRDETASVVQEALGPDLGQCCGGHVTLGFELFMASDMAGIAPLVAAERQGPFRTRTVPQAPRFARDILDGEPSHAMPPAIIESFGEAGAVVGLFGAGHVGRAVVLALAPLPVRVVWHDERAGAFPSVIPGAVTCLSGSAEAGLNQLPDEAQILVMTHSHALDLAIVASALRQERFSQIGLIGSATKRARFMSRLAAMGLEPAARRTLRCPIGIPGIIGKDPAVIAASVAAECLILAETHSITTRHADRRSRA